MFDEIPGIGPKKKKALLKYFKDINEINEAKIEDLTQIKGINDELARSIKRFVKIILDSPLPHQPQTENPDQNH